MTTNNWQDGTANWTVPGDWSTGAVPVPTDDVVIVQGDPQITSNVGTVNSVTVANTGQLEIDNGGALAIDSTAGFGTAGIVTGFLSLSGNALLVFTQGGQLTSIGANNVLSLSGPNAFVADAGATTSNSALALASNAGILALDNGASLATPGALTNDAFTGEIDLLNTVGSATPTTLTVNSAAGFGTAGVLTGSVNLRGNALLAFSQGGQLNSIAASGQLSFTGPNGLRRRRRQHHHQ